jgi:putative transposase
MPHIRFPMSRRKVEDLLARPGMDISHETVRYWWNPFGPVFARDMRRQHVGRMSRFRHWRWHLDEKFVKPHEQMLYLTRAGDHEGEVHDQDRALAHPRDNIWSRLIFKDLVKFDDRQCFCR